MRNTRHLGWLVLVVAIALCGPVHADDRDFLREVAAPPNIIFILDTSSSMVSSPEVPGVVDGAKINAAMVPGAGDDPYSRLGIAKRVLREFLETVGEANFALAGYAQAPPPDVNPAFNPLPRKHWVYEARAQDRFHMVESTYAYRMGYAETHAGLLLDVPGDILKQQMIGHHRALRAHQRLRVRLHRRDLPGPGDRRDHRGPPALRSDADLLRQLLRRQQGDTRRPQR
jgi:hypothetical protein